MRKISLSMLLVFTMVISLMSYPTLSAKADETSEIRFMVNYGQTDARKMADLLNDYREANGVNRDSRRRLRYDYDLEKAAMQRAAEIAVCFDYGHGRPDGQDYLITVEEYGFDISPRGVLYGENILFGTEKSMELDNAFGKLCDDENNRNVMLGYYTCVGIGHIKLEDDKTDFWVQIFSDKGQNDTYEDPVDGQRVATVVVSSSKVASINVSYNSGEQSVAAGATVPVPNYTPIVKFTGSELDGDLTLLPLTFNSDDGYVRATGSTMTGLKEGTGTISTDFLGRNFSYSIAVTAGNGMVPTTNPTPVPTETPTPAPTEAPTPTPTQTPDETPTPTADVTPVPDNTSTLKTGDTFENDGLKYKVISSNKVSVSGLSSKKAASVTIPATIKQSGTKFSVTKIDKSAFEGCNKLKNVTIGRNVKTIGAKAFKECSKLSKIKFEGTSVTKIGTDAFKKINNKANILIPSKSAKKYKSLLKNVGLSSKAKVETYK